MSPLSRADETSPEDAFGLQLVDQVVYPIRRILKKNSLRYQFQSPAFSPQSTTLVVVGNWTDQSSGEILNLLESMGFKGEPKTKSVVCPADYTCRVINIVARFLSVDVHGENRPAIRIAYNQVA